MSRPIGILLGFLALLLAAVWSTLSITRRAAHFSFCNAADVGSLDPAIASDSSTQRVLSGVFEGLCVLHPQTLEPQPGMASNIIRTTQGGWKCLSPDGKTWTFEIREDARWSDNSPLTANDFAYSFRRVLDPQTAAPYPHLLGDYVINAEKYNSPQNLAVGDSVEVELPLPNAESENSNKRGQLLRGTLIEKVAGGTFHVEVDGVPRFFQIRSSTEVPGKGSDSFKNESDNSGAIEDCRQVLLDFHEVGIRAVDSHTLQIELMRPNPAFLQVLAHVTLSPVNQRCLEAHSGREWTHPNRLISNGAYVVAQRRLRDRIRLQRNPYYWDRGHVGCEMVDAITVESPATMLNLFEAGLVDWVPSTPVSLADDLRRVRANSLKAAPAFSTYFYVFNVRRPPFNDIHIRRAFCQAINRREVVDTALRGGQETASGFVPPGISGYASAEVLAEDPTAARHELQQADAGSLTALNGSQWKLLYNTGDTHRSIAELIQSQWREATGIHIALENREFGTFRAAISAGEFDIARSGWTGDISDPIAFLHMFASDSPFNDAGWANDDYDRLLGQAGVESDPVQRLSLLQEAETILLKECPVLPLYHRVSMHLVRPGVRGFYANSGDIHPLKWIHVER
ncbi:MAG: peptide ABC transporter substrate-binding protein [Pirellulales bacterium]|nr:peptide ABC transporter substrate-binding protein [Pirellulales bacterium]